MALDVCNRGNTYRRGNLDCFLCRHDFKPYQPLEPVWLVKKKLTCRNGRTRHVEVIASNQKIKCMDIETKEIKFVVT